MSLDGIDGFINSLYSKEFFSFIWAYIVIDYWYLLSRLWYLAYCRILLLLILGLPVTYVSHVSAHYIVLNSITKPLSFYQLTLEQAWSSTSNFIEKKYKIQQKNKTKQKKQDFSDDNPYAFDT